MVQTMQLYQHQIAFLIDMIIVFQVVLMQLILNYPILGIEKRISTPIIPSHIGDLKIQILVNVTQVGSTTQIESDVNGFDRFQAIFNITDGSASSIIRAYFGGAIGVGNSSVAYFGHQLEQGSYATSYIPTSGSAVTRVADVCEGAGNSEVFNDSEGVIYVETKPFVDGDFESGYISLSDGTTGSNFVTIQHRNSGQLRIYAGGFLTPNIQFVGNLDMAQNLKIAVQYKQNDYKLFVNGTKYDLYLTPTEPAVSGLSQLDFNVRGASTHNWCAKTKELKIYNTALTDAELETLTT